MWLCIVETLVLRFVIPVACTYGEPVCDEVGAQFYLLIVFLMSGGRGRAMVFSYQSIPLGADTSILHHAFISIFIALWAVITHYVTILMPILSYFTRFA